jgi:spore coat protein U-like protein
MTAPRFARLIRSSVVAVAAAGWAAPAVAASCILSAQSVAFGAYDPFEPADLEGVGNISISCDSGVAVTVSLSAGTGSFSMRTMMSDADQMVYNLFTTAQRISVWGDGSGGSDVVSATIQSADLPVYGLIPAGQNLPRGTYTDVITITVTY